MDQQRKYLVLTAGAVIAVVALCALSVWGMSLIVPTDKLSDISASARDILIIILAIESIFVGAFLLLMLWQLYQLIKLLREEVVPLLNTTRDTVEQVKHTTTFVGQSVAAPVISVAGIAAGAREMLDTLRGKKAPHEILREDQQDG